MSKPLRIDDIYMQIEQDEPTGMDTPPPHLRMIKLDKPDPEIIRGLEELEASDALRKSKERLRDTVAKMGGKINYY